MFAATRVAAWGLVVTLSCFAPAMAQEGADPFGEVAEQRTPNQVREALDAAVPEAGFDFENATLDQIVQTLGNHYGIRIRVDYAELEKIGLGRDDTYSFKISKGTLRHSLNYQLKQFDVTYAVKDGKLVITTIDKVLDDAGSERSKAGSAIAPFTFPAEPTPVFYAEEQSPHTDKIRKVLREPLHSGGLEFNDTHLTEVIDFLRREYEIEIQLDRKALDDLGLSPDDPISVNLRNISLGAALRITLLQLDMTYVVRDEVLLITSVDESITHPITAVYPVGDILQSNEGVDDGNTTTVNQFVSVVTNVFPEPAWDVQSAAIECIQPGLLVVTQTQEGHERVQQLLAALRQAKKHAFALPHKSEPPVESDKGGGGMF